MPANIYDLVPVLTCDMSWILCTLVSPNSWDHSDGLVYTIREKIACCDMQFFPRPMVLLGMAALIFFSVCFQIVFASAIIISDGDVCAGINDKLGRESIYLFIIS